MPTPAWSTQQLAEFVATVSAAERESAAAGVAVERAAEALDADVAAIVRGREVLASVGYPQGAAPFDELAAVKPWLADCVLDVPGIGTSPAAAASLDHPTGSMLVVARPDALTPEEAGLLRGMARVASMTMRMLHVLDDERAAREELEEVAGEHAALRRVATLVAEAAPPEAVFSAVAEEVGRVIHTAAHAFVARYHRGNEMKIVGAWSRTGGDEILGRSMALGGRNVSTLVFEGNRPARVDRFPRDDDSAITSVVRGIGSLSSAGAPINVEGRLWGVMIAGSSHDETLPAETEQRLARFTEIIATAIANAQAREELRRVADEQAALRRVATLIARGAPPSVVFDAVAAEVGSVLGADFTLVNRYGPERTLEVVGGWSRAGATPFVGSRTRLGGHNVSTLVFDRREPARVDRLADDTADATTVARASGARSSAGAPVSVEGRLWGVMIVASAEEETLPAGIEHRLADFTELVATAIADAQAREELRRTADEQAALRRVATLVARAAPPAEVFAAVAKEVARLFAVEAELVRYDPGVTVTVVGSWSATGASVRVGTRLPLGGHNVSTLVFETGRPARIEKYRADDSSPVTATAREMGGLGAVGAPVSVAGRLWGAAIVVMPREEALPADTEERLADFAELVATAIANTEARDELRQVADEQAALGRVATLVARAAPPSAVLATVAEEVGRLLSVDHAYVTRYDGDDAVTVLAGWIASGDKPVELPRQFPAGPMSTLIRDIGGPARLDPYPGDAGAAALEEGVHSAVAAPITVKGRLWGFITVGSTGPEPPPLETEERLANFTELAATAIANADAQAELTASRARIVASADETRRRIERDLHDGAQQRLVTLALQLRAAQAAVPPGLDELAAELDRVVRGLNTALDELREFARGIHPAILAEGGLGPALKALARRSPVAIDLDVRIEGRLPEPVEVGAYFVVSEALTNVAKHARATRVGVDVEAADDTLRIHVRDDGVGGAEFGRGSGLVGLRDRVEALGGRIALQSEPGLGTSLCVELPIPRSEAVLPAGAVAPDAGRA
ncbi:MAG TPA: GAF domain-containing sensor histidine kinase [Thermoleophilaceae bacterium]|nr:GAF domain-containing sensor histidine kinase [Thermoleophilaceae bacterium]